LAVGTIRGYHTATGSASGIATEKVGNAQMVYLDRPKALNSLNLPMIRELYPLYKELETKRGAEVICMKGTGGKAFCAGGDIVAIYRSGLGEDGTDPKTPEIFFFEEYLLNERIHSLAIPHVALLNGITMGGGVGLSVHGRFRVAYDNTLFAMPEARIGFFCDVGGSYFLPRLPKNFGYYLALTGERLKGADLVHFGIATHYVGADDSALVSALQGISSADDVSAVLDAHQTTLPPCSLSDEAIEQIGGCFAKNTVEEIYDALDQVKDEHKWAAKAISAMNTFSPTSLKVILKSLHLGARHASLKDALRMEYAISQTFMRKQGDFFEGVRAALVDKDQNPRWNPAELKLVTEDDVNEYFDESRSPKLHFESPKL